MPSGIYLSSVTVAGLAFAMAGCAASQNVADPKTITLEDALIDTQHALSVVASHHKKGDPSLKFYGCSVTAVFNVSATATMDNKLVLTAGAPATSIVSINGSASTESTASGTRANTVTVVLDTPYCLPGSKIKPSGKPPGPVLPGPH